MVFIVDGNPSAAVAISLVTASCLGGLTSAHAQGTEESGPSPFVVELQVVAERKAVFATVESVDVTEARARIEGTIEGLRVGDGSKVERDQLIANVRDPKLSLEEAALEARVRALATQLEQADLNLKRIRQLRQTGSASQSQLDDAQTTFVVGSQQLAAARAERAVLEQKRRDGEVHSPAEGRVLKTHVVPGAVVMPGESVATIAVERYVLRLNLPERHARFIRVGDSVLVGQRGLEDDVHVAGEGTIRKVYPRLVEGKVVADVEVAGLGDYFVGERARVWVKAGERTAILIPRDLLATRFGVDYVRIAVGPERTDEVVVQTGRPRPDAAGPGMIEILSGLRPGDVLLKP